VRALVTGGQGSQETAPNVLQTEPMQSTASCMSLITIQIQLFDGVPGSKVRLHHASSNRDRQPACLGSKPPCLVLVCKYDNSRLVIYTT